MERRKRKHRLYLVDELLKLFSRVITSCAQLAWTILFATSRRIFCYAITKELRDLEKGFSGQRPDARRPELCGVHEQRPIGKGL